MLFGTLKADIMLSRINKANNTPCRATGGRIFAMVVAIPTVSFPSKRTTSSFPIWTKPLCGTKLVQYLRLVAMWRVHAESNLYLSNCWAYETVTSAHGNIWIAVSLAGSESCLVYSLWRNVRPSRTRSTSSSAHCLVSPQTLHLVCVLSNCVHLHRN